MKTIKLTEEHFEMVIHAVKHMENSYEKSYKEIKELHERADYNEGSEISRALWKQVQNYAVLHKQLSEQNK